MSNDGCSDEGQFLRRLQRLLTEGEFVSTYKFALILALVRWSQEHVDHDERVPIDVKELAPHFLDLYWPHVQPFAGVAPAPAIAAEPAAGYGAFAWQGVLWQDRGGQIPRVFRLIREWREQGCVRWHDVPLVERDRLLREVALLVQSMPLWKLHTLRGRPEPFRFLYRRGESASGLYLEPGALAFLVDFAPLIAEVVRSAWVGFVLRCNPTVLTNASGLEAFLFPTKRISLDSWRPLLLELQQSSCFYCGKRMVEAAVVDHFLPWSRYPRDLGHNFVLAHAKCNAAKSDHLAAEDHLARWCRRNHEQGASMAQQFAAANLPHDWPCLWQVAHSLYRSASASGSGAWLSGRLILDLTDDWRGILASFRPTA